MKFLLPFALLLFVLSCTPKTAGTDNMDSTTSMDMPSTDGGADVQATIDAVESNGGDITALPASAAVSNIDGWINKLQTMDGTNSIVKNLKSLKSELGAGSINGTKVSGLLSTLASETRSLSGGNAGLTTLAGALDAGADKLSGK